MPEQMVVNGREYGFHYKEQPNRTIIFVSSSERWDKQDADTVMRLGRLLSQNLLVSSNPKIPRMLFIQKNGPNGNGTSVHIEELKATVKACLKQI
jgi:hypothetical protein